MADKPKPLPMVRPLAVRAIKATSDAGTDELLLEIGAPVAVGENECLCFWNLLSGDGCISRGGAIGTDRLEALLRALRMIRMVLLRISRGGEGRLDWNGQTCAGIPEVGPEPRASDASVPGGAGESRAHSFPPDNELAAYLDVLKDVLMRLRQRGRERDQETADLAEAVHNLPELLQRWPSVDKKRVFEELRGIEDKYLKGSPVFTGRLTAGVES